MNLFTAQKHASFAAKLFTAAGFDFQAALAANDAEALKNHIAAQSPAAVTALFANAGLNFETLLAAGPESLKAHLASLDNAAQVAALTTDLATAKSQIATLTEASTSRLNTIGTYGELFAAIGITDLAKADAPAIKTAFESHVAKATTLALSKTGHPPVVHIDANAAPAAEQLSDEAHLAAYEKLQGAEAKAYLAANAEALWRADIARRTQRP